MATSVLIDIKVPTEQRIESLVRDYGSLDKDFLIECTERIRKRLGLDQAKKAVTAIQEDRIADFIRVVLVYYDKTYRTSLGCRDAGRVITLNLDNSDLSENARYILRAVHATLPAKLYV
jgi:tRNA 2-selenouridine synthase